jgi:hypothetical protein
MHIAPVHFFRYWNTDLLQFVVGRSDLPADEVRAAGGEIFDDGPAIVRTAIVKFPDRR